MSTLRLSFFVFTFLSFFHFSVFSNDDYVGSQACQNCHQKEFSAWKGSHHDMSMTDASNETVLGNFDNQQFISNGIQNKFFKKGSEFWVNISDENGQLQDYKIKYTFGYEPLQQYMVEFDDGRVQLIPFAWDSRSKQEGGQRWFNLYPEMTEKHQEFHWKNTGQNWNYMCADCHSTNVEKNFDVKENKYNTTFSEINVGCESCHGPAKEHLNWTATQSNKISDFGFSRDVKKSVRDWITVTSRNTLAPKEIKHSDQNTVCAQCHSRHVQISNEDHVKKKEFGQRYLLSLITPSLYYADGQVYEENFVYGSFLQSKMNKNGVVCSNCHEPHSAKLIIPQEQVCLQCHQPSAYNVPEHHHHQKASEGAQCVNCHMPESTYMEVDDRRDHGWHIPRPDLAKDLGTPDTCLSCHDDKTSQWSNTHVEQWFPNSKVRKEPHFASLFTAVNQNYPGVAAELSKLAQTQSAPVIIRASALERMASIADTNTLIAIARGAKSNETLIRIGAANGAVGLPINERWRILEPLLTDRVLAVRSEAAIALVSAWSSLSNEQQSTLAPALSDYLEIQKFNDDRGFAHTNIGNVFAYQGSYNQAEAAYRQSIRIERYFPTAYLNLAQLYKMQNQNGKSKAILKEGINIIPDNGELYYALGLALIRDKNKVEAAKTFEIATKIAPNNANYFYIHGLSLESLDLPKAYHALGRAFEISRAPQHLYALCEMQVRYRDKAAMQCLNTLKGIAPEDAVRPLVEQVKRNGG